METVNTFVITEEIVLDLIKIGVPALVAILATFFSFVLAIKKNKLDKELRESDKDHDKQMREISSKHDKEIRALSLKHEEETRKKEVVREIIADVTKDLVIVCQAFKDHAQQLAIYNRHFDNPDVTYTKSMETWKEYNDNSYRFNNIESKLRILNLGDAITAYENFHSGIITFCAKFIDDAKYDPDEINTESAKITISYNETLKSLSDNFIQ